MNNPVMEFINVRRARKYEDDVSKVAALLKDVIAKATKIANSANSRDHIAGLDEFRDYINDIQKNWDPTIQTRKFGILQTVFNMVDRAEDKGELLMSVKDLQDYLDGKTF